MAGLLHAPQHVGGRFAGRAGDRRPQLHLADPRQVELFQPGPLADEPLDELVGRLGEDVLRGVVLDDVGPLGEHRRPVAELHGLLEVVGDDDDGLVELALDPQQLVLQPLPGERVDGPEGLVHQQYGRVGGQRPGDADALLLAPGQLPRVAVPVGVGIQGDQIEQLVHPLGDLRPGPVQHLRHHRDIGGHAHVREQPAALDDVADPAPQLVAVHLRDVVPADDDASAGGLDEPVDHLQRRRLAASRRPDQGDDLPGRDLQRQVVDGGLPCAGVALGDVIDEDLASRDVAADGGVGEVGRGLSSGHGYLSRWSVGRGR